MAAPTSTINGAAQLDPHQPVPLPLHVHGRLRCRRPTRATRQHGRDRVPARHVPDTRGATNLAERETFYVYRAADRLLRRWPPDDAADHPDRRAGEPVQRRDDQRCAQLAGRPYIDVKLHTRAGGRRCVGIDGDEIRLSGPGAVNLDLTPRRLHHGDARPAQGRPDDLPLLPHAKAGVDRGEHVRQRRDQRRARRGRAQPARPATIATPAWQRRDDRRHDAAPGPRGRHLHGRRAAGRRRRAPARRRSRSAPLTLDSSTIGLVGTTFKDGKLVLTIGIGVARGDAGVRRRSQRRRDRAADHGEADRHPRHVRRRRRHRQGRRRDRQPGRSCSTPSACPASSALGVTHASLVEVPNVFKVTANGIKVAYDPNYEAADHGGKPQEILVVQTRADRVPALRHHRRRSRRSRTTTAPCGPA